MPTLRATPVSQLPDGSVGHLSQVRDETPDVLRFLAEHGVTMGARLTVVEQSPLAGTTTLRVEGRSTDVVIGAQLARHIDMEI
jgi:DtxR family Mn-dependent transcriptional regulator